MKTAHVSEAAELFGIGFLKDRADNKRINLVQNVWHKGTKLMKSTLRAETKDNRLGNVEKRASDFSKIEVPELMDIIHELLKEFSSNRRKRKITLSLSLEKEGR